MPKHAFFRISSEYVLYKGQMERIWTQKDATCQRQIDRLHRGRSMNRALIAVCCFLMLVGCQMDKRFSRLETGMTKAQVIGIVGKPDAYKVEYGTEVLRWHAGNHYVKLRNGRVTEYGEE